MATFVSTCARGSRRHTSCRWIFGLVGVLACSDPSSIGVSGNRDGAYELSETVHFRPSDAATTDELGHPDAVTVPDDGERFDLNDVTLTDAVVAADLSIVDSTDDSAVPTDSADIQPHDADSSPACPPEDPNCVCIQDSDCLDFDDDDRCNGAWICGPSGACQIDLATVVQCPLAESVCGEYSCAPDSGQCALAVLLSDGSPCDDGDACSQGDHCQAGMCLPGTGGCDDGNPCTDDVCQAGQCIHSNNQAVCDDDNPCTGGDFCAVGLCHAGAQDLCSASDCEPWFALSCEQSYGVSTVVSQATDVLEAYPCAVGVFSGPEIAHTFQAGQAQLVEFVMIGGDVFRLFVLDGSGQCNAAACLESSTDRVVRQLAAGERVYVVVDGPSGGSSGLQVHCYDQTAELCDNGRDDDWDGATDCADDDCDAVTDCIPIACPDGICHPTAEDCESCPADCGACSLCPDGTCTLGYETCESCPDDCDVCFVCPDGACTAGYEDCHSCEQDCGPCPACGDGSCAGDETCVVCPADCGDCLFGCTDEDIVCGASDSQGNLEDDEDISDFGDCSTWGGNGDHIYRFAVPSARSVSLVLTIASGSNCSDYDLYVLDNACDGNTCVVGSADAWDCTEEVSFSAQPGRVYLFVVKAYSSGSSNFQLAVTCN